MTLTYIVKIMTLNNFKEILIIVIRKKLLKQKKFKTQFLFLLHTIRTPPSPPLLK